MRRLRPQCLPFHRQLISGGRQGSGDFNDDGCYSSLAKELATTNAVIDVMRLLSTARMIMTSSSAPVQESSLRTTLAASMGVTSHSQQRSVTRHCHDDDGSSIAILASSSSSTSSAAVAAFRRFFAQNRSCAAYRGCSTTPRRAPYFFSSSFSSSFASSSLRRPLHNFVRCATACHCEARRFQSNRRPTVSEITKALATLGVSLSLSDKELKKKYIDLVRIHHPDRGGDVEKMKDLTTSYDLISGLSESEKKEYEQQLRGGYGGAAAARRPGADGSQAHHYQRAYDFSQAYRHQRGDPKPFHYRYQPEDHERRAHGTEHLFRSSPLARMMLRWQHTPLYIILLRAMLAYFILTSILLILYRQYQDGAQESEWRGAANHGRHERMEEMMKWREEQASRMRDAEKRLLLQRKDNLERAKEKRALEYAERRTLELRQMEAACWPRLAQDGTQGTLLKDPKDPVGITYYDPPDGMIAVPPPRSASASSSSSPDGTAPATGPSSSSAAASGGSSAASSSSGLPATSTNGSVPTWSTTTLATPVLATSSSSSASDLYQPMPTTAVPTTATAAAGGAPPAAQPLSFFAAMKAVREAQDVMSSSFK